jgi:hypothetical protein
MGQAVHIILGPIAQHHAVNPFPQKFRHRVPDEILLPRIPKVRSQRFGQPEPMVRFSRQQESGIRRESISALLDLHRTIEGGLEKRAFPFTHQVNFLALGTMVPNPDNRNIS